MGCCRIYLFYRRPVNRALSDRNRRLSRSRKSLPHLRKKRVEDGCFTFLVQLSDADLPLECDGDRPYGYVNQSHADAA